MNSTNQNKGRHKKTHIKPTVKTSDKKIATETQGDSKTSDNKEGEKELCKQRHHVYIEKGKKDSWDKATVIATLVGVILTAGAFVIAAMSLRASNKALILSNTPYIQFDNFDVLYNDTTKRILVNVTMSNVGQYPAQMVDIRQVFVFGKVTDSASLKANTTYKAYPVTFNRYLMKEQPIEIPFEPSKPLDNAMYDSVKNGKGSIYFAGVLRYKNLISDKIRTYNFAFEVIQALPNRSQHVAWYSYNEDE